LFMTSSQAPFGPLWTKISVGICSLLNGHDERKRCAERSL